MAEYNVDEYTVEGEDTQYNLKISLVDNKINLQLTEISSVIFFIDNSPFNESNQIIFLK